MSWFPQVTQFPARKMVRRRTIATEAADGSMLKLADGGAWEVQWELELKGLTVEEWAALDQLFEQTRGQAGSFTYFDPFGNLLQATEELNATAWTHSGSLALLPGRPDPFEGTQATRAAGAGWIEQAVAAPGGYQYCLSVYARSEAASGVTLSERAGTGVAERRFAIGPAWRRIELPCRLAEASESVSFRIAVEGPADLYGPQAEAQAGASAYKRSGARSGVYANARFASDELRLQSEGLGAYSCLVRIRAGLD